MAHPESHEPKNIALIGHGKMGKMVEKTALARGHQIVPLESADVVIDFSHPSAVLENGKKVLALGKPLVIGTTGWEKDEGSLKKLLDKHAGALLYSPNFSLGVFFFMQIMQQAATWDLGFEAQGIEIHHNQKVDAPSGTAKKIASCFSPPLPFTSIRLGHAPGTHTVIFDSPYESITLTHEARSREGFALGAVRAAEWLIGKKGWFNFDAMVRSLYSPRHPL